MAKRLCNERTVTNCPICGAEIKVAWSIKADQHGHECGGDLFTVTEKCEHLTFDSGTVEGFDGLYDAKCYR